MNENLTKAIAEIDSIKSVKIDFDKAYTHLKNAKKIDLKTASEIDNMKGGLTKQTYASYIGITTVFICLFASVLCLCYCNKKGMKKTKNNFNIQLQSLTKNNEEDEEDNEILTD